MTFYVKYSNAQGYELRIENPRVGGSSPSFATIFSIIFNILLRFKKDLEALFALHTSYTLFVWLSVTSDHIVFIVIGCV